MLSTHRHLSDEVLILSMDGDLPSRRLIRARRHLAACAACAARLEHLECTLADAARLSGSQTGSSERTQDDARAQLRARLRQYAGGRAEERSAGRTRGAWGAVAAAAAAIGIAAALVSSPGLRGLATTATSESRSAFLLPRANLTPGATLPLEAHELCAETLVHTARPVAREIHQQVFASYGADFSRAAEYELDHLITPELGGASDPGNLWPQPFGGTPWNAYVKDELELLFRQKVCDGSLDLATAQREIAGDWIAAYKRYFNTNAPLRDYAASPLTALDPDLLRSELLELGVAAPPHADGGMLMAMLRETKVHP